MTVLPSMSPAEFCASLDALGVGGDGHVSAAARMLGVTPRAIRHWRDGGRRIRGPVVVLLHVLQIMTTAPPAAPPA